MFWRANFSLKSKEAPRKSTLSDASYLTICQMNWLTKANITAGSVCDLEFRASIKGGQPNWQREYSQRPRVYKGTAGGRAFQFGAATDDQTAADTNKLSGSVSTGAATFSFIQVQF